jgi:hypothetical protein
VSGFVGFLNLDGAPVNRRVLARMVKSVAFRGPDDEHIWTDGPVGLGHTLLKTTNESQREKQPFALDDPMATPPSMASTGSTSGIRGRVSMLNGRWSSVTTAA